MIVNVSKFLWVLIFVTITLTSCDGKKYSIQELNQLEIIPPDNNDRVVVDIEGKFLCKTTFEILMDDSVKLTQEFNGTIDTTLMINWYQNKLSFNVYPIECAGDDIKVKVALVN